MNKKRVVMISVAIGVWVVAAIYLINLFNSGSIISENKPITSNPLQKNKTIANYQSYLEEATITEKEFNPAVLELDIKNIDINSFPKISEISYKGYIINNKGSYVLISKNGNINEYPSDQLIEGKYYIVDIRSYGLIVLDITDGTLNYVGI